MTKTYERTLGKDEDKDWAWELVGLLPDQRKKMMEEKVKKWYSPRDVARIKKAFMELVTKDVV